MTDMTDAIRDALEAVVRFTDHYHCKMPTLGADEALAALGDGAREALAALVTPADVGELVERLRKHETYAGDYMLIGEEDKTIRETVAALERVVMERDEARRKLEVCEQYSLENHVRAFKWMEAHDALKAGVPYKFPSPADLPTALARAEAAEAKLAEARARLETVEAAITKANDRLPGIETPMMRGDNLAICLCSFFDDGDKETEDDTGWSESARNGYEEVIAAIREHYAASIRNLEPRHD